MGGADCDRLSHLNAQGEAHMVDVGGKPATERGAVAEGWLSTSVETIRRLRAGETPKGDVLAVARVAGIMAAKRTAEWIPLCHPLSLSGVEVDMALGETGIAVSASVRTRGSTGAEMEALTAVSATLLTLYDMLKGVDRSMELGPVRLVEKWGGRSGHFRRDARFHV
jgi:cyclic pyranopterin phosphate synthase